VAQVDVGQSDHGHGGISGSPSVRRFAHGFVTGKFYPLHAGHSVLIHAAVEHCDRVTVCLLGRHDETIPLALREAWLREVHPDVDVVAGYDDVAIDYDDAGVWARHVDIMRTYVPEHVDAVFTSEAYGEELAYRLGAMHVCVDLPRRRVPCSGSAVRADPAAYWWALPPPVRAWYCTRIVIVGAESTGTTTLAKTLAAELKTQWVPEFGREWCRSSVGSGQAQGLVGWRRRGRARNST
jgi:HTH-type transcriptional regulator, transcriptional repressor of NAD biosynthesis genes